MKYASFHKVGGLWHWRIGAKDGLRIGGSFYLGRAKPAKAPRKVKPPVDEYAIACECSFFAERMLRPIYGSALNTTDESIAHFLRVSREHREYLRSCY